MFKIMSGKKFAQMTEEIDRLRKIRPIAESLERRGISADDILSGNIRIWRKANHREKP